MPGLVKRILLGDPLATWQARLERLGKATALGVFSADGLSSVAYATEEILLVLVVAGPAVAALSLPIGLAIVALVFIVAASYNQTIHAYPSGGGSYIVSRENLGVPAGLVAAAALLVDYVLTVAVSTAAGVAAVTSAFPRLHGREVVLSLIVVWIITAVNLRGVRESGLIFSGPTYAFIGAVFLVIGVGLLRGLQGDWHPPTHPLAGFGVGGDLSTWVHTVGWFQILRAFSSGCTALTGIEAISNGVQAFRPPEADNAIATMKIERTLLYTMFAGITLLAFGFQAWPKEEETVLSQIAREVFGTGPLYYGVQVTTALILLLAANTAFADFPRLASFLARDGFLPRQFANRGDRLVFSNGILILGLTTSGLLVLFGGSTHALIPLYAVGVFMAFTLSQAGMVLHWRREGGPRWWQHAVINGLGAALTGIALVIIGATKFTHGAWIVVLLIPCIVAAFLAVHQHYQRVAKQLSLEQFARHRLKRHLALVFVSGLHQGVLNALEYAKNMSPDVQAVTVDLDSTATAKLRLKWQEWAPEIPLLVLESPYRSMVEPLRRYVDQVQRGEVTDMITIILPEFVPKRWWHHLLHNQTALLIKGAFLFRPGTIVVSVPYHLQE